MKKAIKIGLMRGIILGLSAVNGYLIARAIMAGA